MPLIECPDCSKLVSDSAPTCVHCGRPLAAAAMETPTVPVETRGNGHDAGWLGSWLLIAGIVGLLWAFNLDTSVEAGGEYLGLGVSVPRARVNNLGLMEERRNYLMLSGLACVIGVIVLVTARSPDPSTSEPAAPSAPAEDRNADGLLS